MEERKGRPRRKVRFQVRDRRRRRKRGVEEQDHTLYGLFLANRREFSSEAKDGPHKNKSPQVRSAGVLRPLRGHGDTGGTVHIPAAQAQWNEDWHR